MKAWLRRIRNRAEQGQATLEAVLALPCILVILLVALEGALMFTTWMDAQNAAKVAFLQVEAHPEYNISADHDLVVAQVKEAVEKDTGWDPGRVEVTVETVGDPQTSSYRHQIVLPDGNWAVDAGGALGRPSQFTMQDVRVTVRYLSPAATPAGLIAAAFYGGEPAYRDSYPVVGSCTGSIDTTSKATW